LGSKRKRKKKKKIFFFFFLKKKKKKNEKWLHIYLGRNGYTSPTFKTIKIYDNFKKFIHKKKYIYIYYIYFIFIYIII